MFARSGRAEIGEAIVQPGRIDVGCAQIPSDIVADLSDFVPLDFDGTNLVDAAIAEVRPGMVDTSGAIRDIGPLSPNTMAPIFGLQVKKSARTTGLTFGHVAALDVSVNIGYSKKCGSRGGPSALFTNQFRVESGNNPGPFGAGGDSGGVIVENVATNPRAVGLLFAGSSSSIIANPIDAVLSAFNVSMVGGTPPAVTTGCITGWVTSSADGTAIDGATVSEDTGQSGTTVSNGSYMICEVPTGERTVTASAAGFESQTKPATVTDGGITPVDFALDPTPVGGSNAIVDCITYKTEGGRQGDKHVNIEVLVVDDGGAAVSGAAVSVTVTFPSGATGSATATTGTGGIAGFTIKNGATGCYVTDVTDVAASGLTFDGAEPLNGFEKGADLAPDADCRSGSTTCGNGSSAGSINPNRPDGAGLQSVIAVKRRNEAKLLELTGVVGVGVGLSETGEPVIEVYLDQERSRTRRRIPAVLEDAQTRVIVTGPFVAF